VITRLEFSVRGTPKGQPRTKARAMKTRGGKWIAQVYNPKGSDGWKSGVTLAARQAGLPPVPWEGPVSVTIDAYFERPQRLCRAKDPDGPIRCTAKPDRDNIEKAVLDALTAVGLWKDDAQVCDGPVRKWYVAKGCVPGVRIVAELLEPEPAQQMELRP
jgi:Holliday junction resolvase RusA-like endonuclease